MLFFYLARRRGSHVVECYSYESFVEDTVISIRFRSNEYRVVPTLCVKRMYPGIKWRDGQCRTWPLGWPKDK
jgi:hypothetical protein